MFITISIVHVHQSSAVFFRWHCYHTNRYIFLIFCYKFCLSLLFRPFRSLTSRTLLFRSIQSVSSMCCSCEARVSGRNVHYYVCSFLSNNVLIFTNKNVAVLSFLACFPRRGLLVLLNFTSLFTIEFVECRFNWKPNALYRLLHK